MKWAFPEYVWWLIAIPLLGLLLMGIQLRARKVVRQWFGEAQNNSRRQMLRFFMRSGGLALVILALPGPFLGTGTPDGAILGREVYFLIDASASMNATDLNPSRLEAVKQEIQKLSSTLKGDRLGIIVFTAQAYTYCPLTDDQETFLTLLNLIETKQFSSQGTDLRAGLMQCLERFSAETPDKTKPIGRAVILFTDGENFGENYTSVTNRLSALKVHVLPVMTGSEQGASVPAEAGSRIFKKDKSGATVISRPDPEALQGLAKRFRQPLFQLSPEQKPATALRKQLDTLPPVQLDAAREKVWLNRYAWLLLPGILLFGISFFLLPRTHESA